MEILEKAKSSSWVGNSFLGNSGMKVSPEIITTCHNHKTVLSLMSLTFSISVTKFLGRVAESLGLN